MSKNIIFFFCFFFYCILWDFLSSNSIEKFNTLHDKEVHYPKLLSELTELKSSILIHRHDPSDVNVLKTTYMVFKKKNYILTRGIKKYRYTDTSLIFVLNN